MIQVNDRVKKIDSGLKGTVIGWGYSDITNVYVEFDNGDRDYVSTRSLKKLISKKYIKLGDTVRHSISGKIGKITNEMKWDRGHIFYVEFDGVQHGSWARKADLKKIKKEYLSAKFLDDNYPKLINNLIDRLLDYAGISYDQLKYFGYDPKSNPNDRNFFVKSQEFKNVNGRITHKGDYFYLSFE